MNILIDTNIIIPLEDTNKLLDASFANMRRLASEQHHCLCIHPMQYEDIKRDNDSHRRNIVLSRLNQYSQIENPPILTEAELRALNLIQGSENDKVDNNVLFALYRGAVHLLVTNDLGIHKKAIKLGINEKVYRFDQFLTFLEKFNNKPISSEYTGVIERHLYEIDKSQTFFDSLRQSYDGFDEWFQKCAEEKRKCWCIEGEQSRIVAICIYKHEQDTALTIDGRIIEGKILKLCTFKVDPSARGKKLGERLLYIAFDYCKKNNYDWVYLHTFGEEQKSLVGLCIEYGFSLLGSYGQDDVYIKPMKLKDEINSNTDSFIRFYPYFPNDKFVQKYIIPIQPAYHEDLFPDYSKMRGSLFEKEQSLYSSQGNTIKKAYLCHSKIKSIKRGDIVLFYRSNDRKSIQCMGIVEAAFFSSDINEVIPAIAKRTVYNFSDIENILRSRTLVILFRYIGLDKEIPRSTLIKANIKGNIQSIRKISDEQYSKIINEN
ncbi:MAG: GNAT family N-acetyltransferase [Prevotella sp.]|nr:GNAT family N-acetyltransferase [Prevotella sp.]